MKLKAPGTRMSLSGVAVLAACACGTSSRVAQITNSFGISNNLHSVHSLFVVFGSALIVAGLWQRERIAAAIGSVAVGLLLLGEFLAPPMSVHAGTALSIVQMMGFVMSLLAAVGLVAAFYRAFPSRNPKASLTAMSGAVMAMGCNCCLVTMALAAPGHVLLPGQAWAGANLTIYTIAAALMATGLSRLGGWGPAAMAVIGQAFLYFWLELPYSALPSFTLNGVDANFMIKYPMMLAGSLTVMSAFVLAYRTEEKRIDAPPSLAEPAFGD